MSLRNAELNHVKQKWAARLLGTFEKASEHLV